MATRAGRTKTNYIGAYLDDATKLRLDQIKESECQRVGTKLTMNQVFEILINRFPLSQDGSEPAQAQPGQSD